jgi:hypothetical protein
LSAAVSITIPSSEPSSSAWYSPEPASATAGSRVEKSTAKAAVAIAISEIVIASSSIRRAPAISDCSSPQRQISRPAVAARVSIVSAGAVRRSGLKTEVMRTTTRPTVSAISGEMPA